MKTLVAFLMASTLSVIAQAADVTMDKDFGEVMVGSNDNEAYAITAPDDADLYVTSMSLDGKGFWAETDCLGELPAGYTCYVEVNFEPQAVGDYVGTLKAMTSVDNYTVNLKGKGVEQAPQQ
ncbi:MAG: hypothetical protein ACM3MG_14235 [Bacillota bacterium]